MSQGRWIEHLNDYDFELLYHPGKANVVANVLSRKRVKMSTLIVKEFELIEKLCDMNMGMQFKKDHIWCSRVIITNDFLENIKVE